MVQRAYGMPPVNLGQVNLPKFKGEHVNYLYLPVYLPPKEFHVTKKPPLMAVPERLKWVMPIMLRISKDSKDLFGHEAKNKYVYLTVKTLFVQEGNPGNRPGWHVDGYGSEGDLNYIWHDKNPTEFAIQPFVNIPDDDLGSMEEMGRQVIPECIKTYPNKTLLRLNEDVVHRVGPVIEAGIRTFIKVSVSDHRYNLVGNAHNYLLDYDWEMADREVLRRNCDNKDFAVHK